MVDRLHRDVSAIVGRRLSTDRRAVFVAIHALARERAGLPPAPAIDFAGNPVPHLDEPWYCCAEPNPEQLQLV
jgi:hypothetical protein